MKYLRFFTILVLVFIAPSASNAQIGILASGAYQMEQGSFTAPCGCTFDNGSGGGYAAALTYDMVSFLGITLGMQVGVDVKQFTSAHDWLNAHGGQVMSGTQVINVDSVTTSDNAKISTTNIELYPYLRFTIPATSIFISVAAGTSLIAASHFDQYRNVVSAAVGGQTLTTNLKYPSGASDTTLENGPVQDLRSLVYSARVSAGYDFSVFGLTVAPMVTYDAPLSDLRSVSENNWRISSLYGSIWVRFGL